MNYVCKVSTSMFLGCGGVPQNKKQGRESISDLKVIWITKLYSTCPWKRPASCTVLSGLFSCSYVLLMYLFQSRVSFSDGILKRVLISFSIVSGKRGLATLAYYVTRDTFNGQQHISSAYLDIYLVIYDAKLNTQNPHLLYQLYWNGVWPHFPCCHFHTSSVPANRPPPYSAWQTCHVQQPKEK